MESPFPPSAAPEQPYANTSAAFQVPVQTTPPRGGSPNATEAERNAMRAYLQRSEVRLSTLHRIATAFINGAGLLILLPVLFRDELVTVTNIFLLHITDTFPHLGVWETLVRILLNLFLFYPFVLSVALPLYALYLLLKDMVHFYFSIYTPGFPQSLFTPSFALSGIAFSTDESEAVKREIYEYQYDSTTIDFMIPFSGQKREQYFDETIVNTQGEIIPSSRRYERLHAMGVIPPETDTQTVQRFNAAFGLARTLDRTLSEEVATQEASLVRHVLYLRRLVLRYVKTLLIFLWTALITFIMLPFLEDARMPQYFVLAIGYFTWSVLAIQVLHQPLRWIYRHRHKGVPDAHVDRQLLSLERRMRRLCQLAIVTSGLALILCFVVYGTA